MKRLSLVPLCLTLSLCSISVFAGTPVSLVSIDQPLDRITAEIACGELLDKITILQIKTERIKDPEKLKNIQTELESLLDTYEHSLSKEMRDELEELVTELKKINETLWDIEDNIRDKERAQEFDTRFVELARSVYFTNDERCAVKRKINMKLGSRIVEEKSYKNYKR